MKKSDSMVPDIEQNHELWRKGRFLTRLFLDVEVESCIDSEKYNAVFYINKNEEIGTFLLSIDPGVFYSTGRVNILIEKLPFPLNFDYDDSTFIIVTTKYFDGKVEIIDTSPFAITKGGVMKAIISTSEVKQKEKQLNQLLYQFKRKRE